MKKIATLALAVTMLAATGIINAQDVNIGKSNIKLSSDLMTPEALWAMGRIGGAEAAPDGKTVVFQVGYYSVKANKGHQVICTIDSKGNNRHQLTKSSKNETDPTWIEGGSRIAFLTGGQLWSMNPDGTDRRQLTKDKAGIEGFKFSPDGKKVILIKSMPFNEIIKKNPDDLPKATGRLVTDLMYRHWDHYVENIQHPFLAEVTPEGITEGEDILKGEPYECPMEPFGGVEQLAWSPDSKTIAYTCRKKTGVDYAISTDSDIYIYNIGTRETTNLCKPADYKAPAVDPTHTMRDQKVNAEENLKNNPGYDQNPKFSPDGRYVAWQSMARDGYEADLNRLCVYELATGTKNYVSTAFDSNVDDFCWNIDSKSLTFIGVWHGCINMYQVDLKGKLTQLTDDIADFGSVKLANDGKKLLASRQSISAPTDLYIVTPGKNPGKTTVEQLTHENDHILNQLSFGKVEKLWVKTTDGKDMLTWVILPSNFDPNKKYPTLLFCEGGPQSPVSQFWSYRWNFQIMAANGYIVVAPNRRGLPGYGMEWLEAISGDYAGQCMKDYLSAIDAVAQEPYVDETRLGCVGASFGGYSVYWLAGHHNKRFKCFISHDGIFNTPAQYLETEEMWFPNWDFGMAPWLQDAASVNAYTDSPHLSVDKWDTPILCIHGMKDYRILHSQAQAAFNAARLRGIEAQMLLFTDENHWVLKPQNAILWQRTFFNWLDKWLK